MAKTETLNLRVSADFKRRLTEEAAKEKRSVTNYLEVILTGLWGTARLPSPAESREACPKIDFLKRSARNLCSCRFCIKAASPKSRDRGKRNILIKLAPRHCGTCCHPLKNGIDVGKAKRPPRPKAIASKTELVKLQ